LPKDLAVTVDSICLQHRTQIKTRARQINASWQVEGMTIVGSVRYW